MSTVADLIGRRNILLLHSLLVKFKHSFMLTFIFLVIIVVISFCLQRGYPNWDHLTKLTNHIEVFIQKMTIRKFA